MSNDNLIESTPSEADVFRVDLGNVVELTLGGSAGSSEDKRFVYN